MLSFNANRRVKQALINADAAIEVNNILDAQNTQVVVEETLTLTNAVSKSMTAEIPSGAIIKSVAVNLQTAVTGDASGDDLLAKIGLGISGTIAKYGVVATLTKNSKLTKIPTVAVLGSAETLVLYALKTDGATACTEKFVAGGIVKVRVVYEKPAALPDA